MPETYRLVRVFENGNRKEVIAEGLKYHQAFGHIQNPNSNSETANDFAKKAMTGRAGNWQDCIEKVS